MLSCSAILVLKMTGYWMALKKSTKENGKIQKGVYYTTTKDSFFLQSVLHTDSTTTGKRKSFPNEIKIYGLASFTFFFSVQQFKVHSVAMLFLTDLPRVRQNYQDILLLHIQLFFQHIIDFEELYTFAPTSEIFKPTFTFQSLQKIIRLYVSIGFFDRKGHHHQCYHLSTGQLTVSFTVQSCRYIVLF